MAPSTVPDRYHHRQSVDSAFDVSVIDAESGDVTDCLDRSVHDDVGSAAGVNFG